MIAAALALIARTPWQAWLVAALIVIGGAYHLHAVHAAYERGGADYKAIVEAANKASSDKADKGEASVRKCPPGKWNREAGKCER